MIADLLGLGEFGMVNASMEPATGTEATAGSLSIERLYFRAVVIDDVAEVFECGGCQHAELIAVLIG